MRPETPVPRLLVVDDEESILFALWDYLVRSGYEVDRARNRQEAERLLDGPPYALAIVDLRLGVQEPHGGLHVLRRVRERSPRARTILLTAYGSPEMESELSAEGAGLLLSKPQPLARIAEEVSRLLAGCPAFPGGPPRDGGACASA